MCLLSFSPFFLSWDFCQQSARWRSSILYFFKFISSLLISLLFSFSNIHFKISLTRLGEILKKLYLFTFSVFVFSFYKCCLLIKSRQYFLKMGAWLAIRLLMKSLWLVPLFFLLLSFFFFYFFSSLVPPFVIKGGTRFISWATSCGLSVGEIKTETDRQTGIEPGTATERQRPRACGFNQPRCKGQI